MKKNNITLITATLIFLLSACTEEKDYAPVTQFLGFSNSGMTTLDDQVTVTVKLPLTTRTVDASYFGKVIPVTLSTVNEDNKTYKTGSIVIQRSDLAAAIAKPGDRAYVWFKVDGSELNMSSTQVQLNSAMTAVAPTSVFYNNQLLHVSYAASPVVPANDLTYKIYIKVQPGNPTFAEYTKPHTEGVIDIKGTDFNKNDTVTFKITATARGLTDEITTNPFIVGPNLFQHTASVALVVDSSASAAIDNKLLYLADAAKIVNVPWTVSINGGSKVYSAITILSSKDSVITNSLTYIRPSTGVADSIVYTNYPAKYMVVKTENYTATAEGYDFIGNTKVYRNDAASDFIFNGNSAPTLTLGGNTTLYSCDGALYNGKDVSKVMAFATAPPPSSAIHVAGSSFSPKPGDMYVVKVVRGGDTAYAIVKFGASSSNNKLMEGSSPVVYVSTTLAFEVVYGGVY